MQNPAYGNRDKRPRFWPQHYWPWERLTDVHSKPRGMAEPLNYSEMMKLAIARGYRFFGYNPFKYVDRYKEDDPAEKHTGPGKAPHARWQVDTSKPPILPRPVSQLNCVQARTVCAKMLRFQQGGIISTKKLIKIALDFTAFTKPSAFRCSGYPPRNKPLFHGKPSEGPASIRLC
jgi:hypothetical protein